MASLLCFSLPKPNIIKASSTTPATTTTTLPIPEALDEKFGRKGIKFSESNNVPFVELTVRNGSSLKLRIPDAHVTSYKPKVYWKDDGFQEILYTVPAGGEDSTKAKGGIGLVINDASDKSSKGSLLSGYEWTVKDADNDAIDALQVFFLVSSMDTIENPFFCFLQIELLMFSIGYLISIKYVLTIQGNLMCACYI